MTAVGFCSARACALLRLRFGEAVILVLRAVLLRRGKADAFIERQPETLLLWQSAQSPRKAFLCLVNRPQHFQKTLCFFPSNLGTARKTGMDRNATHGMQHVDPGFLRTASSTGPELRVTTNSPGITATEQTRQAHVSFPIRRMHEDERKLVMRS